MPPRRPDRSLLISGIVVLVVSLLFSVGAHVAYPLWGGAASDISGAVYYSAVSLISLVTSAGVGVGSALFAGSFIVRAVLPRPLPQTVDPSWGHPGQVGPPTTPPMAAYDPQGVGGYQPTSVAVPLSGTAPGGATATTQHSATPPDPFAPRPAD